MLDTDICASVMRGPSNILARRLQAVPITQQVISVVTLAELQSGVRLSHHPKQNQAALDAFLVHVIILDWARPAVAHYAYLRAHLHRKGQMIAANDLMIAAHALAQNATLVTNNEQDFRQVPSLKLANWTV